jgi:2-(1,2-epoxy-1,2-dihydrophenyl)acetyl-CoA isomerase
MSTESPLLVTLENGIKRITFNRPKSRNAITPEMFGLFSQAILDSVKDDSKVIILTGAEDAFCAGADLGGFNAMDSANYDVSASLRNTTNPAIIAMRETPKPIIARVHGFAAGIGCNYALACDLIIASEEAKFAELFVRIGLMPDGGGTHFVPQLVGYHKAFEMIALGETVTAQEAFKLGIVNRVVPYGELDATVDKIAERLKNSPALSLANIKAGLNYGLTHSLAESLEFEAVHQAECFHSADFREGVLAFIEKRKAVFSGK